MEWLNGAYRLTTETEQFDIDLIHQFLRDESYWAKGISRALVERSIKGSLCFGMLRAEEQVGFGRLITDEATFAYLADLFIVPSERGQGLSKWMLTCILSHPSAQGLRSILLRTADAQGLYQQFGFAPINNPQTFMIRH